MDWQASGTVIARSRHGENAVILRVMTREYGLASGVVPGGASARRAAMLQPGVRLALRWRARLDDHLGTFAAEPEAARPGLLGDAGALAGLNAVCALLNFALPERDPHPRLHDATEAMLDQMDAGGDWAGAYLRWELLLLDEMGFGLELSRCAVSGTCERLAYVSPRSGHAVSQEAAGEWAPRLLPLPPLLGGVGGTPGRELTEALALTGHFLNTRLAGDLVGRPLPEARARLVRRLTQE